MQTRRALVKATVATAAALCCATVFAQKGETVKIVWIDPLSGLMAPVGQNQLRSFQFFAEKFSQKNPAGVIDLELLLDKEKLSIVVEDDGKGFDHRAYREQLEETGPVSMARKRHQSGAAGGLGIYLMDRCADRLEYSERGNRLTLMKYRAGAGSRAS